MINYKVSTITFLSTYMSVREPQLPVCLENEPTPGQFYQQYILHCQLIYFFVYYSLIMHLIFFCFVLVLKSNSQHLGYGLTDLFPYACLLTVKKLFDCENY